MAGESATQTEPELELDVEEWKERLRAAYALKIKAAEADEAFRLTVRAAFAAGLTVVPIQEATGLTTSRLYQIKAGRRT